MSQQESMFMPPEKAPPAYERERARSYERAPEVEPASLYPQPQDGPYHGASYEEGYQAYDAFYTAQQQGEKLKPPDAPFSENRRTFFILCVIAAFCVGGILGAMLTQFLLSFIGLGLFVAAILAVLFFATANRQTIELPTRTFEVAEQAHLHLHNETGTINIARSNGQHVEVRSTLRAGGYFARSLSEPVQYTQTGDDITITTKNWNPANFLTFVTVSHTVLIPDNSTIEIDNKAGTLIVGNVQGQIKARLNSGSVTLRQATLKAGSELHTNAGTLHIERSTLQNGTRFDTNAGTIYVQESHLQQGVRFHTSAGTVHVQESQLEGDNQLTTNAGTIYVEGVLSPQGSYQFKTNMGTVHVALPASSAFTLDAKTSMGTVSNDFGSNSVGTGPQARLNLRSDMGSIRVERR